MSDPELLTALIEDPDALPEADWQLAQALIQADPRLVRLHLLLDERLGRILDPGRADIAAAIRQRIDHPAPSGRFVAQVLARGRQRRQRSWWLLAAGFAAAACLTAVLFAWLTVEDPQGCRLSAGDLADAAAAAVHGRIPTGSDLVAGPLGAEVRYADGTSLRFGPQAQVRWLPAPGKRLLLSRGRVDAEVAPQPSATPMNIATPHAAVTVVGTRLRIEVGVTTAVTVLEGSVQVEDLADRRRVAVAVGESARFPAATAAAGPATPATVTTLLSEDFESDDATAHGWYDNDHRGFTRTAAEHAPGSAHAAEFRFPRGAELPLSGGTIRHLVPATDAIRISYWLKYSPEWANAAHAGSMLQFLLLTDADPAWEDPSYTHLTCAIGTSDGIPYLTLRDPRNADTGRIGQELAAMTEDRAVCGGNGASDSLGRGAWFMRPDGRFWNEKRCPVTAAAMTDQPGPFFKGGWHRIEVSFRLNRIVDGKGAADGHLAYVVDGQVALERSDVLFRTARHPDMRFNQLIIGPWYHDGAPNEQTFWIDDLSVSADAANTTPSKTAP